VHLRASHVVGTIVVLGAVTAITVLGFDLHAHAARSAETQHHGLERDGVVASVQTVHHDTSHDSWTTYDYDVTLTEPVGDVSTTVAHDPTEDLQRYDTGERISVLVDPEDQTYAELPGKPVQSSTWYLGPLILGLVFFGLVTLIAVRARRLRRRGPG
jgi:hypothetical protein